MPPPFQTGVFFLPSIGSRAQMEAGMAGRDPALYQEMLADLRELAIVADDLGYDAIAFTEHHFHIEGFEISNNPVLLDTYVALHTKRIRVGQLGIVLPASSPLRWRKTSPCSTTSAAGGRSLASRVATSAAGSTRSPSSTTTSTRRHRPSATKRSTA